jgi:hypothetical protein
MKRVCLLLALLLAAGCGKPVQRTVSAPAPSVDLNGTYILDVVASSDFKTDAHKYVFLNGVDEGHPINITQTGDLVRVAFTTRWNGEQTNILESIGETSSLWLWTTNGLVCTARPSYPILLLPIPGAAHLDQRCTITQTEDASLVIERSTAEGGRMLWLFPWKDPAWTSTLTLRKQEGDVTTTKSTLSAEAAPSATPSER